MEFKGSIDAAYEAGNDNANDSQHDKPLLESQVQPAIDMLERVNRTEDRKGSNGNVYGVPEEKRLHGLTARQRMFAHLVAVQGMSPLPAYKKAYADRGGTDESKSSAANRLLNKVEMGRFISTLLDKKAVSIINDASATRRHVLTKLLEHAEGMKNEASKLKALELLGKSVGMFTDRVESKVETVDAVSLKRDLEDRLSMYDMKH